MNVNSTTIGVGEGQDLHQIKNIMTIPEEINITGIAEAIREKCNVNKAVPKLTRKDKCNKHNRS